MKKIILLAALGAASALAQFQLAPFIEGQYFDNNGQPLAGGWVVSCGAGLTCTYPVPGNPLATFTDASGTTPNANPIPLDASGRASIWLNTTLAYKLVLVSSTGVIIKTVDNIQVAAGGGGPSTNYWTLIGTTISNNNGAGVGNVSVGASLFVGGMGVSFLSLNGSLQLQDAEIAPHFAIIRAPNCEGTITGGTCAGSNTTWRWPMNDMAGCMTSDGSGNLSFQACSGGGGGGSPGGLTTDVQYNNAGAFGGSGNFTWNNGSQLLTVTATGSGAAGIAVATGFMQADNGFLGTMSTCLAFNCFQAPGGGMHAKSFTAINYVQTGHSAGVPALTASDTFNAGAQYWDDTARAQQVFNGSAWVSLGGGSGSPGGADTDVQFNSSGGFGGSSNLTWNNTTRLLTVTSSASSVPGILESTGFIQADAGFLATLATATQFNSIQAPGGGLYGKSLTALNYVQTGNSASNPPPLTNGDTYHQGAQFFDIGLGSQMLCTTGSCSTTVDTPGSGWVALGTGGGGSPAGPTTSMQFNNAGAFGGSANNTWNNTTRLQTITTAGVTAGLSVVNGFIQADTGFLTVGTATNAIQAPNGGTASRWLTASDSLFEIEEGTPPLSSAGQMRMYADSSCHCLRFSQNGQAYQTIGTGGVSSLNGETGVISIIGTADEVAVVANISTIQLSTPQPIATNSSVTFGNVTTPGTFNNSGSGITFQNSSGNFQVNSSGALSLNGAITTQTGLNVTNTALNSIQTSGNINACNSGGCAGGSAISVLGTTMINSAGQWVGGAVLANGNIQTTGVYAISGGFFGQTVTVTAGTCQLFFRGGILFGTGGSC